MRWRWWKPEPTLGGHRSWPDHGRDSLGRQVDGDRVRADGRERWVDLLPGDAGREALTGPTRHLPIVDAQLMTRGQRWRGSGGRR